MTALSDAALRRLQEAADAPDLSGTKYQLGERIGQGGMGTVYRARDAELGRDIALKVVRLPEASPDVAARMVREARTLARLEHPGIVPVHDVGTLPDGRVFYAMKLVRGSRLDALPPTPLAERLRIVERICEAVAFAHAHGIIHRDLKPQNVMVGPFGEVLVMDWGVAKLIAPTTRSEGRDEAAAASAEGLPGTDLRSPPVRATAPGSGGAARARERPAGDPPSGRAGAPEPSRAREVPNADTGPGVVLGTPGYMAPEQAAGDPGLVDARADVYSVGAILRDVCLPAAAAPDGAGSTASLRPLEAIVRKAMAGDPASRYATIPDLARDIAAFRSGERVLAYRENLFERGRRLAARYSTPILLVLAYLLMRLALLAVRGR